MSIVWTGTRDDLSGSRWDVWNSEFRSLISWEEFKAQVHQFNPSLATTGWLFKSGTEYQIPGPEGDSISNQAEEPDFALADERAKLAQIVLKKDGLYRGEIDGIIGSGSKQALQHYQGIDTSWAIERQITAVIQRAAKKRHIDAGKVDGFYGPQTDYAADALWRLFENKSIGESTWRTVDSQSLNPNNWPVQYTPEFLDFYGEPGESELVSITLPYRHVFSWNPAESTGRTRVHRKVKDSLIRVLENVVEVYGLDDIKRLSPCPTGFPPRIFLAR